MVWILFNNKFNDASNIELRLALIRNKYDATFDSNDAGGLHSFLSNVAKWYNLLAHADPDFIYHPKETE